MLCVLIPPILLSCTASHGRVASMDGRVVCIHGRVASMDRRYAVGLLAASTAVLPAHAEGGPAGADYNKRARGMMNEKALIPGDYYYIFGQVPPRRLSDVDIVANIEQPKWNVFGSCIEDSCVYVPIAQRYSAYTKYEPRLTRGLDAFRRLPALIQAGDWSQLQRATYHGGDPDGPLAPAPAVDALLKAGLLASLLLVSPNNL